MIFPTEQTVYRITGFNGYKDVKRFQEPLSTELGKDEVLIKVKAVSLNYRDFNMTKNRSLHEPKLNVIPGSDASGEVVKVGTGVFNLAVGDRVITNFDPELFYGVVQSHKSPFGCVRDGVLTRYKIVSKYGVNKLPNDSHLTHEEAATLVCTGVTVWNALYGSSNGFIAGQTILLLGTGGISITALVLAKAAGAVVIITSSSDEKLKYVKEKYGADYTINYKSNHDWENKVLEITNGRGVDLVLESGGNGTIIKSIKSVKVGGQIALIGLMVKPKEMPDILSALISKGVTARGILVGSKQLSEGLIQFVHAKKLHMPVENVFGFSEEEVQALYSNFETQKQVGKSVIKVD